MIPEPSGGGSGRPYDPTEWSAPGTVLALAERIGELAERIGRPLKLMHICGTHEHEIGRWALRDLLPDALEVLAGPGCPVCVCDARLIDAAIVLAQRPGVTVASFGDMLGVPGAIPLGGDRPGDVRMSLDDARARGGDVRGVYSVWDAAALAERTPERQVVFFSVGFETTVVAVAALLRRGAPANLSILEANYYTPAATALLPDLDGFDVDGFLLPGHASAVTGIDLYAHLPARGIACAAAGFEPVDVLAGLAALLEQIAAGAPALVNAYPRVVPRAGNRRALAEADAVFELVPRRWRGVADIPASGYALRPAYRRWSAAARFAETLAALPPRREAEHARGCRCADVTLGLARPRDCALFGTACTPASPFGPCMVSDEGTCRAWHRYGMGRERIRVET